MYNWTGDVDLTGNVWLKPAKRRRWINCDASWPTSRGLQRQIQKKSFSWQSSFVGRLNYWIVITKSKAIHGTSVNVRTRARIALVLKLYYLSTIFCQQLPHVLLGDAILRFLTRASCACPRTSRLRIRKMASFQKLQKGSHVSSPVLYRSVDLTSLFLHILYDALFTVTRVRFENEPWQASFSSVKLVWHRANILLVLHIVT